MLFAEWFIAQKKQNKQQATSNDEINRGTNKGAAAGRAWECVDVHTKE